jgi:hypothetical protein
MRAILAVVALMFATAAYAQTQDQDAPKPDPVVERLDRILAALSQDTAKRKVLDELETVSAALSREKGRKTALGELEKANKVLGYDETIDPAALSSVLAQLKLIVSQLRNRGELEQIGRSVAADGVLDKQLAEIARRLADLSKTVGAAGGLEVKAVSHLPVDVKSVVGTVPVVVSSVPAGGVEIKAASTLPVEVKSIAGTVPVEVRLANLPSGLRELFAKDSVVYAHSPLIEAGANGRRYTVLQAPDEQGWMHVNTAPNRNSWINVITAPVRWSSSP